MAQTELPRLPNDGMRVLIVDDNTDEANSLAVLICHWGHDALIVRAGHEAVLAARNYRPRVILLNLGIPNVDGYEIARQCREELDGFKPLIFAVTGFGDPDHQERAAEHFDFYFVKPLGLDILEELLDAAAETAVTGIGPDLFVKDKPS